MTSCLMPFLGSPSIKPRQLFQNKKFHFQEGLVNVYHAGDVATNFMLSFENVPIDIKTQCEKSTQGYNQLIDEVVLQIGFIHLIKITGQELTCFGFNQTHQCLKLPFIDMVLIRLQFQTVHIIFHPKFMFFTFKEALRLLLHEMKCIDENIGSLILSYGQFGYLANPTLWIQYIHFDDNQRHHLAITEKVQTIIQYKNIHYVKPKNSEISRIALKDFYFSVKQLRIGFFGLPQEDYIPFQNMQLFVNEVDVLEDTSPFFWRFVDCQLNNIESPKYPIYILTFQNPNEDTMYDSTLDLKRSNESYLEIVWLNVTIPIEIEIVICTTFENIFTLSSGMGCLRFVD